MKQAIIAALMSVALMFTTPAAFAQEEENDLSGGYVGFAGGIIDENNLLRLVDENAPLSDKATLFRMVGGYRTENGVAVELSYNRYSDVRVHSCDDNNILERHSFTLNALYHVQFGSKFSVFPKIGFAYARFGDGLSYGVFPGGTCIFYVVDTSTEFLYGVGAEFRITDSIAFRADIDKGASALEGENYTWTAGLSFYFQ